MKKLFFIFIILSQVVFVNAQLNGIYQIGASQSYPYNSLKNAAEQISTVGVSGAVTFILTDTLYEEDSIEFKTIVGTSTTNTITLQPADGVDVKIRGSGSFIIGIERTSHLIFDGKSPNGTGSLTITSTEMLIGSSVIKSIASAAGDSIKIINCTINAAPPFFSEKNIPKAYGVNLKISNFLFDNNIFKGGDFGIYSINLSNAQIINNSFYSSGGINIFDGSSISLIKIQGNSFKNTNLAFNAELSIISIFGGLNINIYNNLFNGISYNFTNFKKECSAFFFTGTKNINITNNIIKNINYNATFTPFPNLNMGSFFKLFLFTPGGNIKIYHNSIYIPIGNENGFVSGDGTLTVFTFNNCQNIEFKNNIITALQGNKEGETVNSKASIFRFISGTDIANLQTDNNIYYVDNHTNNYFCNVGNQDNYDFDQWKATFPSLDQNSYWEMPNVISPNDLHLSQDCNRGTPIAEVPLDFEGTTRSTTSPDIGAYELLNELNFVTGGNCQLTLIQFSIINGVNIQSVLWNFGDSQTSTEINPTHTYTNAGTYTVTLQVSYNDNTTKTISKQITIYEMPTQSTILHD